VKEKVMRTLMSALGVAGVVVAGTAEADPAGGWHEDGMSHGVQVEHRSVPGSHFDELRLSVVTTLSVESVCDAIYPKALSSRLERNFKKQELLRETPTERWTYEQISVPIVSDRDYIVHAKLEVPGSTGQCAVSFASEDYPSRPPVNGFVRIPVIRGHWDVFPIDGGKVSVQYRIFSEPGGGVPAWLSRGGQRDAAVDFMKVILARAGTEPSTASR
jgi:hypothetical protein